MQLILTHKEIAMAIRAYVISQSNANPNEPIQVQIREGRKGNGGTAIVDFEMNALNDELIEFKQNAYSVEDALDLARQEIASILGTPETIEIVAPAELTEDTQEDAISDISYQNISVDFATQSVQPEPIVEATTEIFDVECEDEDDNFEVEVTKTVKTTQKPLSFADEEDDDDIFAQADKRDQELFGDKKSIFDL